MPRHRIRIIDGAIRKSELSAIAREQFGDMVKAVVDVSREILAVGGELHSDGEALLIESGSGPDDLWGINLYVDAPGEDWIEFDSMINLRPGQRNRTRGVEDAGLQKRIREIVQKRVSEG